MIQQFTNEIINTLEASRVNKLTTIAREGGLPSDLVKRVREGAAYQPAAKIGLQDSVPRVACKYLNKTGVSAEYAEEVKLVGSLAAVMLQGRKLQATLEEMIEQTRKLREQNERKNQPQNPGQTPPAPGSPAGPA